MEDINTKVLTALQKEDLDFEVVMREAYTLMNGVPTPNGKFNPVRVNADGSVLLGDIAKKSTEALKVVEMVTLDGYTYDVAPEFDSVFSKLAVA